MYPKLFTDIVTRYSDGEMILPVLIDSTPSLYSLQAAFVLWQRGCPHFLLSTSTVDGPSVYELFFQGASLVSLVNWASHGDTEIEQIEPAFVLPLLYVDINSWAHVYLMREENNKVRCFLNFKIAC